MQDKSYEERGGYLGTVEFAQYINPTMMRLYQLGRQGT